MKRNLLVNNIYSDFKSQKKNIALIYSRRNQWKFKQVDPLETSQQSHATY